MSEHIYLIQTRECSRIDKDVYKLGRSNGIDSRMKSYPKESIIHLIVSVENSRQTETDLIKLFGEKFEKALLSSGESYGNEYFRGDLTLMKQVFLTYIMDKCIDTSQIEVDRLMSIDYDEMTIPSDKIIKTFALAGKLNDLDIIITNPETHEGYLKFKNNNNCGWYRIWDKDSTDENAEVLIDWLEENIRRDIIFFEDESKTQIKLECDDWDDCWKNCKYRTHIEYDMDNILSDLIKNHYNPSIKIKKLDYSQFMVASEINTHGIIDLQTLNFTTDDTDKNSLLVINRGRFWYFGKGIKYLNTVNEKLAGELLSKLFKSDALAEYRSLCHSVLVKPSDITIIFDMTPLKSAFLIERLRHLLNFLMPKEESESSIVDFGDFKDRKLDSFIISEIKNIIKPNTRLCILPLNNSKLIERLIKCGVKNIVVNTIGLSSASAWEMLFTQKSQAITNTDKIDLFEKTNVNILQDFVKVHTNDNGYPSDYGDSDLEKFHGIKPDKYAYWDQVFTSNYGKFFTLNFLKWCCT